MNIVAFITLHCVLKYLTTSVNGIEGQVHDTRTAYHMHIFHMPSAVLGCLWQSHGVWIEQHCAYSTTAPFKQGRSRPPILWQLGPPSFRHYSPILRISNTLLIWEKHYNLLFSDFMAFSYLPSHTVDCQILWMCNFFPNIKTNIKQSDTTLIFTFKVSIISFVLYSGTWFLHLKLIRITLNDPF